MSRRSSLQVDGAKADARGAKGAGGARGLSRRSSPNRERAKADAGGAAGAGAGLSRRSSLQVDGTKADAGEITTSYEDRKRDQAEQRRRERAAQELQARIAELEGRIAELEKAIKALEAKMAAPGFYQKHEDARPVLDEHQALMWKVGDLLGQWEMLQAEAEKRNPSSVSEQS